MRQELLFAFLTISSFLPAAAAVVTRLPSDEFETLKRIAVVLKKTDWNFSVDPCSQEAGWVTHNAPNGFENSVWCNNCTQNGSICHVTSIVLKSQNLVGTLPREMASLSFLQEIDLTRNFLSGTIPDEWAVLPLVNISLLGNSISGQIPSWIGNLTSLTNLALEANQFTGPFPKELGLLRGLQKIQASSNGFSGELPDTFANLSNLIYFMIGSNNFTGKMPQFFQTWTQIQRIDLQASGLQGPIPTGLPLLKNLNDLRISDITGNSAFPQLDGMQQLQYLTIRNCGITGEIPPYLGSFVNLKRLLASSQKLPTPHSIRTLPNWNQITNTVWWQDFPRRDAPDYLSLFAPSGDSKSDFAAQLAGFIASLITDVPSQAHWIKELTKYDFGGAAVHLIASIPGMHAPYPNYSVIDFFQSVVRDRTASTILGTVQASVVGLSHRFHNATDSRGEQLKKLASFFGNYLESSSELVEVVLKRNHNIPADDNAISVLVFSSQEMSSGESVQLGFLPRDVAKWAAPLGDHGFIELLAFVYPMEALTAALDGNNTKVQCLLLIAQGPKFSEILNLIQPEHLPALCLFVASIQRCLGLWRLQEVMSQFKWPELFETDFVYASSSVGTSINSQFLAAFSAAAGKKSFQLSESEESDPEWGCWRTDHELKSPSVRILFPTIDRVKSSTPGIQLSKCLLSFSESTWQRLRNTGILHDAIPNPAYRIGYPMHVKVARRRFQSKSGGRSFGWLYCGSHNFSPAAWGREVHVPSTSRKGRPGTRLRICNYELGIIFIIPPPSSTKEPLGNLCNLDSISLPFAMPAPRYGDSDRPATARAMRDAMVEPVTEQDIEEMDEDEVADDEIEESSGYVAEENEDDKIYAEMLWSQVDL